MPYDLHQMEHGARERQVVPMLWSDKAFRIYIGNAGEGIAPASGDAATDVMASTGTQATRDDCTDVMVAPSGSWLARTVSALANRAALSRIAR